MSLWGNRDLVYSDGTINVDLTASVIHGSVGVTTFTSTGISTGDVVVVGAGATYGYAVITGFTSTTVSIAGTEQFVSGLTTVTGATYEITEQPIYTVYDSVYRAPEAKSTGFSTNPVTTAIFGVDATETEVARAASGEARQYKPAHAGWVGVTTYMDTDGNLRVKTEVLVAGGADAAGNGGITGDADDDIQYPDS